MNKQKGKRKHEINFHTDEEVESCLFNTEKHLSADSDSETTNETPNDVAMSCCVCSNKIDNDSTYSCEVCRGRLHLNCAFMNSESPSSSSKVKCSHCATEELIENEKQKCFAGQKRMAKKLIAATSKFKPIEVGSYVSLSVPKVDRGPLDSQKLIGKVIVWIRARS